MFLGTSRVLFAIDWRLFDAFEQKHRIKMFNLAFAGVPRGEFSRKLIHKWNIQPKLWIIDIFAHPNRDLATRYFSPDGPAGRYEEPTLSRSSRLEAYAAVGVRNFRWRMKSALGVASLSSYRSDETGNWYLDQWPNRLRADMPKMESALSNCSAQLQEIESARAFIKDIGGKVVLTQIPSKSSCFQRAYEIADAVGAPLFAPDPSGYSTTDGGGHLDEISSMKYSSEFFAWFDKTEPFKRLRGGGLSAK